MTKKSKSYFPKKGKVDWTKIINSISIDSDQSAFKFLFDFHYSKLNSVAQYYLKSSEFSDEVVSDVFIKVWDNREKLKDVENIDKYLYVLIKNRSIDYLRQVKANTVVAIGGEDEFDVESSIKTDAGILENELEAQLERSYLALPEKCRIIFRMVKQEELKYKEVADILNVSVKTVEYHIGFALKSIRADLVKYNKPPQKNNMAKLESWAIIFLISMVA